jgi:predicted transport protein
MHFVIRLDKFYQKLHLLIKDNLSKLEYDEIKAPKVKMKDVDSVGRMMIEFSDEYRASL